MFIWTLIFMILALVAGIFGFTSVAGTAGSVSQILFFLFSGLLVFSAFHGHERSS